MFGYIKPFKPQLRICEFDTYQAVYCGLCKELGRTYGFWARFTLSYDFAFLSLLSLSLSGDKPDFCTGRCFAHPLKRKNCCQTNESIRFSAAVAMTMMYYKVLDNARDSGLGGKLISLLARPFAAFARKRAKAAYPVLDKLCADMLEQQFALEEANCDNMDEAAQPTALALAGILEQLGQEENTRRVLHRMGYLLGRWIYLMDAADDLEDDLKKGSYNVFVLACQLTPQSTPQATRAQTVAVLNQTAAEIAKTYDLLELQRYRPILDNVIYLGLKNSLNLVEEKKEKHT